MTLKTNTELLVAILDTYSSGVSNSLQTVAEMNGVSFRSVYAWLRDETLIIPEYMGMIDQTFGKLMGHARNVSKAITISRSLEDRVLNGLKVQIVHHGEFAYVDDEAAIRATKEDFEFGVANGYFFEDKKKRDANGNRIIATRIEAPPAQLVEVYARANLPSIYGNKLETTLKGTLNLGVTTVGEQRPLPPEVKALISPVTETALLPGDGTEVYAAQDLSDLLGPDLASDASEPLAPTTDTPPEVFEPEPVAALPPQPIEPVIRDVTSIPPGWRAELARLNEKLSAPYPEKLNRRA
jgi:hypothetical protein